MSRPQVPPTRAPAPFAKKGSQRWLQLAVNSATPVIDAALRPTLDLRDRDTINWLSPLRADRFVEYRDDATYQRAGISLNKRLLRDFWPSGGPVWDGLALTSRKQLLLVEAKGHIPEIVSPRTRASEPARGRIVESMRAVQRSLSPKSLDWVDWTGTFYQYANRVAHLHFLREDNSINAHLVNVYFLNATDVKGPTTEAEWRGATTVVESYLGLGRHRLSRYVHKIFIDVNDLLPYDSAE